MLGLRLGLPRQRHVQIPNHRESFFERWEITDFKRERVPVSFSSPANLTVVDRIDVGFDAAGLAFFNQSFQDDTSVFIGYLIFFI